MMLWWWRKKYPSARSEEIARFVKSQLGFTPSRIDLFEEALRHSSAKELANKPTEIRSNERLEYLGDAILDSIVAEYLFHNYPEQNEGQLTKLKSKIVSRKNLNAIGAALGLKEKLNFQLGKNDLHDSLLGNALEAMAGAMYLDKGYAKTYATFIKIFLKQGMETRLESIQDYKSKLHEWCQKKHYSLRFVMEEEEIHKGFIIYHMAVKVNDEIKGRGKGKSKKQGEQKAAEKACQELMQDA